MTTTVKHNNLIPSLNGLRAISILMVVFFHLRASHFFDFQNAAAKQAGLILINGELGVTIFFVISGYLITTLLIKEKEAKGSLSLKRFYFKRAFRIVPAYYALLLVYFALQSFHYFSLSRGTWLSLLLYVKQFFQSDTHEVGHIWSLCVEEIFYLIYPVLFALFYNRIRRLIVLLIPLFVYFRFHFFHLPASDYKNSVFVSGDSILIGCFLSLEQEKIKMFITRHKLLSLSAFPLLLASIVSFLYIVSVFTHSSQSMLRRFSFLPNIAYALFGNVGLVTNLLVAYIILMSLHLRNAWHAVLNTSVLNYIGVLSYSIYLWQQLFTSDRTYLHTIGLPLILTIIFAVSFLSYHLVEKPFLKLRKILLTKAGRKTTMSPGVLL